MCADNFLYAQTQPFTLAGAGANITDQTIVLSSMKSIDGVALAMTDFGTIGFGTIEPGNGIQEEQISFSGITQNGNSTATLTGVKTVLMLAPYTQTAGLTKTHAGGTVFVISNTAGFYDKMTSKSDDETITGDWHVPTPAVDDSIANKKYVDDTATFGAPDASTSTKGIVKLSAAPTSATEPIAVGTNDVKVSPVSLVTLTADKVAALAGTGTPSVSNKYVTADGLTPYELLANKDTTVTLGASDTKYPSQNAVKTYVDTNDIRSTVASANVKQSANTERTTTSAGVPVKLKEMAVQYGGVVRVSCDLKTGNAGQTAYYRVYINGVAFGTSQENGTTNYATTTDDITVASGSLVQIYAWNLSTNTTYIRNFTISYDLASTIVVPIVITD